MFSSSQRAPWRKTKNSASNFPTNIEENYSEMSLHLKVSLTDIARWFKNIQTSGHSLVRSLVRSHRSLICLLRTGRFVCTLHCAHSFARSLTYSRGLRFIDFIIDDNHIISSSYGKGNKTRKEKKKKYGNRKVDSHYKSVGKKWKWNYG